MAQNFEHLIQAYTHIGEANASAWESIDGAMGSLSKFAAILLLNQQKARRWMLRTTRTQKQILQELEELHAQIKTLKGE